MLQKIRKYLNLERTAMLSATQAYDLWSKDYDDQPGNLMLALDEKVFSGLLEKTTVTGRHVIDVGCGTGRNWNKLLLLQPMSLVGYDVSDGMLAKLKQKYPGTITHKLAGNKLTQTQSASCDILISTLTIAHIENIEEALVEWARVVKDNGRLIITDYHPDTLAKGGQRTFKSNGETFAVKNYVHTVKDLLGICTSLNLEVTDFKEIMIDEKVKHFYEVQHALHVYERFKGLPIIFGIGLKKKNGVA